MSDVAGISRNNGASAASPQAATPFNLPAAGRDVEIAQRLPEAVVENRSNTPVYAVFSAVEGKGRVELIPPGREIRGADAIVFDDNGNGIDKKDLGFRFTDGSRVVVRDTAVGPIAHHTDAQGLLLTVGAGIVKGGYGMQPLGKIQDSLGPYPLLLNGREIK